MPVLLLYCDINYDPHLEASFIISGYLSGYPEETKDNKPKFWSNIDYAYDHCDNIPECKQLCGNIIKGPFKVTHWCIMPDYPE